MEVGGGGRAFSQEPRMEEEELFLPYSFICQVSAQNVSFLIDTLILNSLCERLISEGMPTFYIWNTVSGIIMVPPVISRCGGRKHSKFPCIR